MAALFEKSKTPDTMLKNIPKGKTADDRERRKQIIRQQLAKYVGKAYQNGQLSMPVKVIPASIEEIAQWACLSKESTQAALHLPTVVRNAKVLYIDVPKEGQQMKKFKASLTITMEYRSLIYGHIKLMICDSLKYSEHKTNNMVVYCITRHNKK